MDKEETKKSTKENRPWVGVDLDGTLAEYTEWRGTTHIGKPVRAMCDLVKLLHKQGEVIKIFTARVSDAEEDPKKVAKVKKNIQDWCEEHLGFRPEVTDRKDYCMVALYDDRAIQVVQNSGHLLEETIKDLKAYVEDAKLELAKAFISPYTIAKEQKAALLEVKSLLDLCSRSLDRCEF